MTDRFDLQRFVTAQDSGGTFDRALAELRAGDKRSHWMWFVFPQLAGLGRSDMAQRYAVQGLEEARAYLDHAVLGPRLRECAQAVLGWEQTDPVGALGAVDAQKLRSSMTLFDLAAPDGDVLFRRVLGRSFAGRPDPATTELLERAG